MRKTTHFALISFSAILFSQMATATPGSLTDFEREQFATDIVVGYVVGIKKKNVTTEHATKTLYTARLIVSEIEKGSNVLGAQTLQVHYWKTSLEDERDGNAGQSTSMKHYQLVRVFLVFDERNNRFNLLSPNGFDILSGRQL